MNQLADAVKAINGKRRKDDGEAVRHGDGCTAVPDFNFRPCCERHDMDYMNPAMPRLQADKRLRDCIKIKSPWWSPLPTIYYLGVRAFGASRHISFQKYNYDDEGELIMD